MEAKSSKQSSVHVYASSAGSGKTYTLVKEYLKILLGSAGSLDPKIYHKILAITFTNKATEEMKSRILDSLQLLAQGKAEKLLTNISKELGKSEAQITNNAKFFSRSILHDYGNMSVLTIDSFFQRIIRSFSKELGLPLSYEIDIDENTINEFSVDELLNDIGKSSFVTSVLETYALRNIDEDEGWDMRSKLIELGKEVINNRKVFEKLKFEETKVLSHYEAQLLKIKKDFLQKYRSKSKEILAKISSFGIEPKDLKGKSYLINYLRKIENNDFDEIPKIEETAYLQKVFFQNEDLYAKTLSADRKALVDMALQQGLRNLLDELAQMYLNDYRAYMSADQVLKHFYLLGVIDELSNKIKEYRKEESILLISDIVDLLGNLVTNNNAPFVFEKVGVKYSYLLIDEFQDTSTEQWNILKPFVVNILSAVRPEFMHVLIVGDGKQSIYRWRGGNMSLLTAQIFEDLSVFEPIKIHLNDNHRSLKNIVDFNNDYFEQLLLYITALNPSLEVDLKRCYDGFKQNIFRISDKEGSINLRFLESSKGSEYASEALSHLEADIRETQSKGYSYSEIAILVATSKDAFEIAAFLQDHTIPVVSSNSLLYKDHPGIKFIVAVIQMCSNPRDKIAYLLARKSYAEHMGLLDHDFDVHNVFDVDQNEYIPDIMSFVKHLEKSINLDIYDLIIDIIFHFHLDQKQDGFIYQFLDFILEHKLNLGQTLIDFLEWWEIKKEDASALTTKDNDAIEIMTVHKSKGLQFPVVFIPYCKKEVSKKKGLYWVEGTEDPYQLLGHVPVNYNGKLEKTYFRDDFITEEDQRIIDSVNFLYVAFTRAADQLFVYVPNGKTDDNPCSDIFKIHTEVCKRMHIDTTMGIYNIGSLEKPTKDKEHEKSKTKIPLNRLSKKADIVNAVRKKFEEDKQVNIEAGNVIHEAFAQIYDISDSVHVLNKMKWKGSVSTDQILWAKTILDKVVSDSETSFLFSGQWTVYNERSFLIDGEIFRPDRLLVNNDQYIVIDYKTGSADKKHINQVKNYVNSLSKIFCQQGSGYIIYLNEFEVIKAI